MYGLSPKEYIELRLKCLEPFVTIASKHGIEQDIMIRKAEEAWQFVVKPLDEELAKVPQSKNGPAPKSKSS